MRPLNRPFAPALPVTAYRTFQIAAPLSTHFRWGTCEQAQCDGYVRGWTSRLDETTEQGLGLAHYIRKDSGRRFREEKFPGGVTEFVFEPGQKCFRRATNVPGQDHQIRIDRPEHFVVRDGDWRGNPTKRRMKHKNAIEWVEHFQEHQDKLRALQQRG